MYHPVSPGEVFETEAGSKFLDAYGPIIKRHRFDHDPKNQLSFEDKIETIARWLTGNFDPNSGQHTLYRSVDGADADRISKTGALISRTVTEIGGGSTERTLDELELHEAGRPGRVMRQLEERSAQYLLSSRGPEDSSKKRWDDIHLEDFFRAPHERSDHNRRLISDVIKAIRATVEGGETAYRTAVERAGYDDRAPSAHWSTYSFMHPSIHLTSSIDFAAMHQEGLRLQGREAGGIVMVQFEPGAIVAAPNVGIPDKKHREIIMVQSSESHSKAYPNFDELEWYGLGKIDGNSGDVSISFV